MSEPGERSSRILIEGDDEQPVYIGSGVLLRLAGITLVATAAHNVWHREGGRLARVSVSRMSTLITAHTQPGDRSVHRVHMPAAAAMLDPEPDVAIVELSERAIISQDALPFEESDIGFMPSDVATRRVVLAGFPSAYARQHDRVEIGPLGRPRPLDLDGATMVVHSMPERRFAREPSSGRGVHVYLSPQSTDAVGARSETPQSSGMSGGPLVVPDGRGTLVGLVRSRQEYEVGYDQWCEPIVEAVRLLLRHENTAVADAARRVVERCDRPVESIVSAKDLASSSFGRRRKLQAIMPPR